jgi:glutathione S-transferase
MLVTESLEELSGTRFSVGSDANDSLARFILNYKGLDYETEFVRIRQLLSSSEGQLTLPQIEYPHLQARLEKLVSPHTNPKEVAAYTSPTVIFPDGTAVMESRAIAAAIEERYPSPPLHLDSPILPRLEALMPGVNPNLAPVMLPMVPRTVLNEVAHPYWRRTREAKTGKTLEELEQSVSREECWAKAKPALDEVTALLKEKGGPYFMGGTVSYADFVWGGFLEFMKRLGEGMWEQCLETMGEGKEVHLALLKGVEEWAQRDGV